MERFEFERAKKKINSEFWIDTLGKCHKFKGSLRDADGVVSFHYEIALRIHPDLEYPDDHLHEIGWLAVGGGCGSRLKGEPTQAQINTLTDLGYHTLRSGNGILYKF